MVFDTLENCKLYYGINKNMEKAFDFIKKAVDENYAAGKYEIDGKDIFASVQEYETASFEEKKFEGHRNYLDIQFIVSGTENMKSAFVDDVKTKIEYNDEKDVEFFEDTHKCADFDVNKNQYAIFLPSDIHKPGLSPKDGKSEIKKVLVKIKL